MKRFVRRAVAALALSYPVVLLAIAALFRTVGESWWATGVALYLPRIGFALPLPFLVVLLLVSGQRRLLWSQLVALLILLFPLMGLVVRWSRSPGDSPHVRILSFNVNSGYSGIDKIDERIRAASPDIVLLQEAYLEAEKLPDLLRAHFPVVERSTQFIIASKFPVIASVDPERLPHEGRMRSPRWMRYVVDAPFGRIAIYNLHPVSPRSAFYHLRGKGLRREILSGRVFSGAAAADMNENSTLRSLQIEASAAHASQDDYPVVVVGDLNLPGLSRVFADYLSRFRDGFREVGFGFGYTFPSSHPWMRLDRILTSDELEVLDFEVGCEGVSDHLCVVADLKHKDP
jgi:endonuclease/exonuclease/phosphatase family metal-dependent hydrolase